ncbi:MAG: methyltransferase domain-containing protein [Synechococcaceae cyanobacterium SM2_3_2]|nr:methyltransferase domain-containing protein [Synechococcaceae cyanobacterium SM2_3_2]
MQLNPGRSARAQWQKLSAPIERLIELGLLDPSQSVFDYGCGQGLDVQFLRERGFEVEGWDPYWRAGDPLVESDVVVLNFVLDCIGDPDERQEALQRAWSLVTDYLMVTVRRDRALVRVCPYSDGWLTRWGTFQRLFNQGEFYQFLRETLRGTSPIEFDRGGCGIIPKTENWQERISNHLQLPGRWR